MQFDLDRKNGIPLYIQLKNQIQQLIATGKLKANDKLPPERELAQVLQISRNTVSMAYKELEDEGILSSSQGRGTFVANSALVLQRESMKERLLKVIDLAIEEATGMGFSIDEFVALTHVRAMEKKEQLAQLRVAFVECHPEQLEYFVQEVKLGSGVNLVPILLDDLRKNVQASPQNLAQFDLVITSFAHFNEINQIFQGKAKKILGVALAPQVESLVRIAKLPAESQVAIFCHSETYGRRVQEAVQRAGIGHLGFSVYTGQVDEKMQECLQGAAAVVVCFGRLQEALRLIKDANRLIEFRFLPDLGSLNLIKSALMECKR